MLFQKVLKALHEDEEVLATPGAAQRPHMARAVGTPQLVYNSACIKLLLTVVFPCGLKT